MPNDVQKHQDDNAEYVCVKGVIALRDPKTNNRIYISEDQVDKSGKKVRFKLSHLSAAERAFLASKQKGVIMLAKEWDAQQATSASSKNK